jgi:precorrin-2 dehydrogenase/sirohydrochlorin ferrochelatase
MIPLLHDFRDATVLVFGGGPVGLRRARRFAGEANVVVVSPEFRGERPERAELIRSAPSPGDVSSWIERASPALVVAATDDEALNDAVEAAARDAGALVNRADRAGGRATDGVVVPGIVRDGPVVAAVATSGLSPALSGVLRERIEAVVSGSRPVAEVTADVRDDLRERDVSARHRREIMRRIVRSADVWTEANRSRDEGREAARRVCSEVLEDPDR